MVLRSKERCRLLEKKCNNCTCE